MHSAGMRANFCTNIPLIPAGANLEQEVQFYLTHLGFELVWQGPGIAGVRRGPVSFNLLQNDNKIWAENSSFSIGVSDLDALYEEYRDIPARVGPLEVKAWGRREFHLIVPAGVCYQFFQQPEA